MNRMDRIRVDASVRHPHPENGNCSELTREMPSEGCHSERSREPALSLPKGISRGRFVWARRAPERCFDCASGSAQHDKGRPNPRLRGSCLRRNDELINSEQLLRMLSTSERPLIGCCALKRGLRCVSLSMTRPARGLSPPSQPSPIKGGSPVHPHPSLPPSRGKGKGKRPSPPS